MGIRLLAAGAVAALLVLPGCGTLATQRYASAPDTMVSLRDLPAKAVKVGPFSASPAVKDGLVCRGVGHITPPDKLTYSEYIRTALIDELKVAGKDVSSGPAELTGNLDAIDFSSNGGYWSISLTVTSSNGHKLSVSEKYDYQSSFGGDVACQQTAQALMPAVQDLIGKLVHSPDFPALVSA